MVPATLNSGHGNEKSKEQILFISLKQMELQANNQKPPWDKLSFSKLFKNTACLPIHPRPSAGQSLAPCSKKTRICSPFSPQNLNVSGFFPSIGLPALHRQGRLIIISFSKTLVGLRKNSKRGGHLRHDILHT